MLDLYNQVEPRWNWSQIEAELLRLNLQLFRAADKTGDSEEHGLKMARARLADELRRRMQQQDR
jgi:hypothetical protein